MFTKLGWVSDARRLLASCVRCACCPRKGLPIQASAGGPCPSLRVVSLGADAANRGPSFDMDLAELQRPDGSPIPYEEARAYFKRDPAHRRAPPRCTPGVSRG